MKWKEKKKFNSASYQKKSNVQQLGIGEAIKKNQNDLLFISDHFDDEVGFYDAFNIFGHQRRFRHRV